MSVPRLAVPAPVLPTAALMRRRLWWTVAAAAATIAVAWDRTDGPEVAVPYLLLVGGAVTMLMTTGVVAGEQRSGVADLWLQKGRSPWRLALGGLGHALVASLMVYLVLAALYVVIDRRSSASDAASALVAGIPGIAVMACVVFAFSCWRVRLDIIPAIVMIFFIGLAGHDAEQNPGSAPRWGWLLRIVRFPLAELQDLSEWGGGGALPPIDSWARIVTYGGAWLALGLIGVIVLPPALGRDTTE